jgi:hypothetical protein
MKPSFVSTRLADGAMSGNSVMSTYLVDKEDDTGESLIWQAPLRGEFTAMVERRTGERFVSPVMTPRTPLIPGATR